ncbi:hypothetical protein D3P96_03980 [Weissella viridescens]|uniref:Uncharacterized protein n=1 Tax=Weissella viridescens TaxID=1629 RepID=A0A3P2RBY4_WEIVI|nr:hypothetical protein [Weissella viridescens]RRG18093.1 hypothetical protein D3P96_03980 [Weissella viridescens]
MKIISKILLGGIAVAGIGAGVAYTTQPDLKSQVNTLAPGTHKAGKTTVDDTKTNEELATTVVGLYGAAHLENNAHWKQVPDAFKNKTTLVKEPRSNTLTVYRILVPNTTQSNAPYYELSGPNHNTVIFYDGTATTPLAKADLATIVKYVNEHYSDQQQQDCATRIKIQYS